MSKKGQEPMQDQPATEPTQQTPKGYTIPLPTRENVLSVFRKVAKPKKG